MMVMRGWSGEVLGPNKWSKFDVTLDEHDVTRIFHQNLPDADLSLVNSRDLYKLLSAEAEIYIRADMVQKGASSSEALKQEIKDFEGLKADIFKRIAKLQNINQDE